MPKTKRKHRKTHGKGSLIQIAVSWKALGDHQRQLFEDCAAMETNNYLQEKRVLKNATAAQSGKVEVMATVSPDAKRKISDTESELLASKCSMPEVEDENLVSGETQCVTVDDDLMTDDLEHIKYKQVVEDDVYDVHYQTHQNLMHKLMTIEEQQAFLQIKEQSLKLKVQEHTILQQMRNGRRRNSMVNSLTATKVDQQVTVNSLRATKVDQQAKSLKTVFYDSPMVNIEGKLCNNLVTNRNERAPMKFFDYSCGDMDDADDCFNDLADNIFTSEDNPFLSSPPMTSNGEWFNKLQMKGYGHYPINSRMNDCFDSSFGGIDDSHDSVYDMADDVFSFFSSISTLSNEESFDKLPIQKNDGNGSINFDMKECFDRSYDGT